MSVENFMVTLVLACIGSSGLASIVVALLNRKWSKDDKNDSRIDAIVNADKVLMVDRVRWLSKQYMAQGCISLEDKENLKEMYAAYKALGGNGHLDTAMAEIEKLPVGTEDCA